LKEFSVKKSYKSQPFGVWNQSSIQEWLVMEQIKGTRVFWDGKKVFIKTDGTIIEPPQSFVKFLPPISAEGYLWSGYNKNEPSSWKEITFLIFDDPLSTDKRIEDRLNSLDKSFNSNKLVRLIKPIQIVNTNIIPLYLSLVHKGGSGLIVRKTKSYYFDNDSLLQLRQQDQSEALVISQLGYNVKCILPYGNTIYVQSNINVSPDLVVTIKHNSFSGQTPLNTHLLCIRNDIKWEQVCESLFDYKISYGKSSRPSCRGCGKNLQREQLRVQTKLILKISDRGSFPITVNFCLDFVCIDKGVKKYISEGTTISPFEHKIWVPSTINKSDLNEMDGIQFVTLDPVSKIVTSCKLIFHQ